MLRFSQLKLLRAIVCLSSGQPTVKKRTQIRCYRASGVCFLPTTVFLEVCCLLCRSLLRTHHTAARCCCLVATKETHTPHGVPLRTYKHTHTRTHTQLHTD
uniref:Putative secreted protein n=1 Tax=Anopheles marajoara TaxID=58244 RepID=A0A2M4C8Y3_9DIPT